ncbi:MAG: YggU family protein [Deltaproteobacteria bacterium]|jgi:uncharacterized protein|nr:YggU family protein [Deltaproteobacteria bacterium]
MISIQENPRGVVFKVLIQPRSSKNTLAGLHDDALKVKLTAPPVNNAANRMSLKFLAKALGVPKSSLEIVSGHTNRNKQVLLHSDRNDISKKEYCRLKQLVFDLVSS